jgi:hypothetical protein
MQNHVALNATVVIRRPILAVPDLFLANIDNFYQLHKEVLVALVQTVHVGSKSTQDREPGQSTTAA